MKIEYLERVRENAPNLISLDDQDIDDIKLSEALTVDDSVEDCPMFKQLDGLGIKQSTLLSVVADKLPVKQNEELVIVQSIKSQDPEIKASRNIQELIHTLLSDKPILQRPRTAIPRKAMPITKDPMRESTMSFFKQACLTTDTNTDSMSNFFLKNLEEAKGSITLTPDKK